MLPDGGGIPMLPDGGGIPMPPDGGEIRVSCSYPLIWTECGCGGSRGGKVDVGMLRERERSTHAEGGMPLLPGEEKEDVRSTLDCFG